MKREFEVWHLSDGLIHAGGRLNKQYENKNPETGNGFQDFLHPGNLHPAQFALQGLDILTAVLDAGRELAGAVLVFLRAGGTQFVLRGCQSLLFVGQFLFQNGAAAAAARRLGQARIGGLQRRRGTYRRVGGAVRTHGGTPRRCRSGRGLGGRFARRRCNARCDAGIAAYPRQVGRMAVSRRTRGIDGYAADVAFVHFGPGRQRGGGYGGDDAVFDDAVHKFIPGILFLRHGLSVPILPAMPASFPLVSLILL